MRVRKKHTHNTNKPNQIQANYVDFIARIFLMDVEVDSTIVKWIHEKFYRIGESVWELIIQGFFSLFAYGYFILFLVACVLVRCVLYRKLSEYFSFFAGVEYTLI